MLVRYHPELPPYYETEESAVAFSHLVTSLAESTRVIAMLGAGVSTAAGIQDFRSKDEGLYASSSHRGTSSPASRLSAQRARQLFSAQVYTSPKQRAEHWRFLADFKLRVDNIARRRKEEADPEPVTAVHGLLATLKQLGKLQRVYTQNIDGLERAEGLQFVSLPGVTAEKKIDKKGKGKAVVAEPEWKGDCVQLHGSLSTVRCSVCPWVGKWRSKHGKAFGQGQTRDCPACLELAADRVRRSKRFTPIRSYLRPALLLYDEPAAASEVIADIASADLASSPTFLLVCGTSLKIPGFKSLVRQFAAEVQANGGVAVFVNREEVGGEWNEVFDYHVLADCDAFVERIKLESRLSGLDPLDRVTTKRRRSKSTTSLRPSTSALPSSPPPSTFTMLDLPAPSPPSLTAPRLDLVRSLSSATTSSFASSSSPPPCSDFFASSSSPRTASSSSPPSPRSSIPPSSFDHDETPPSSFCIQSSQAEEQYPTLDENMVIPQAAAGISEKRRRKLARREKREAKRKQRETKSKRRGDGRHL